MTATYIVPERVVATHPNGSTFLAYAAGDEIPMTEAIAVGLVESAPKSAPVQKSKPAAEPAAKKE
jgi:hypothetical protein